MRSIVVCTVLLALVATSAQAGAVHLRRSDAQAVQYSCDVEGIATLVVEIVLETYSFVLDVHQSIESIYTGALKCAIENLMNPTKVVICVEDSTKEYVSDVYKTVKLFTSDVESKAQTIKNKMQQCSIKF